MMIGMANFWEPWVKDSYLSTVSAKRGFQGTLNIPFRGVAQPQTTGKSRQKEAKT